MVYEEIDEELGRLLGMAIAVSATAGPDSPEARHTVERLKKAYENGFKNSDVIGAMKKAYELGFKRGFRAAKKEDMPWFDWESGG